MAYKIIMDNLLAEFRAVQKIQAQDAQVIKQLSNEEKARLSLVQKLIKAYLAGEPEEVVLGLLGGNGLAKLTATQNGGEIERLYKELKILLEVETIDPNRYKDEEVRARAIIRIKAEDCKAYQDEFANLDKKAADYKRYAVLNKRLKRLSQDELTTLQRDAGFVIKRTEGLADWLKKAEEHNKLFEKHELKRFENNWRWVLPSEELCQVIKEVLAFSKAGMLETFAEFGFKKPKEAGQDAYFFMAYMKYQDKLENMLTRLDLKKFEDLQHNPALPNGGLMEYIRMPDLPLFKQGGQDADEIDLNDIAQGSVGDCYALAALGAVAYAQPQLIREAIQEVKGGFKVRFYALKEDGSTTEIWVYVDNQFPVKVGSEEPTYAKKGDGELWVMVFEKALAKLAGGYEVLKQGWPEFIISMLTGKKQVRNSLTTPTDAEKVWDTLVKKLSEAGNERLICTLSSYGKDKFTFPICQRYEAVAENGEPLCIVDNRYVYVGNHAYTIIGYNASQASIEVRNPHGAFPQSLRIALLEGNFPEREINNLSYARFFMKKNEFMQLVRGVTWP